MAEKDKAGKKKKPDISSRAQDKKLTFINEAPVSDNNISLTAGPRGAMAMQDIWYQEKLAHFDREVIPGRRMHAKGSGAFGKIHRGPRHHEIYEGKSRPCTKNSKVRHTVHCYLTDKDYGTRLAEVLKLDMTAIEELAKLGNKELLHATPG